MKKTVVLYPSLAVGHLVPMVELAKLFLRHGFSVAIATVEPPFYKAGPYADFVARASAANPSISFHVLAPVALPPGPPPTNPVTAMFGLLRLSNPNLADFLRSLASTGTSVHALVLDMFCPDALDVAAELRIPAYFFCPSGATDLAVFLHLPVLHSTATASFSDMGENLVCIPGLPPIPASYLPREALDRDSDTRRAIMFAFERLPAGKGILVNTLEAWEARAVTALKDGLCLAGRPTPPIYCIGPLVGGGDEKQREEKKHECLAWLDSQPKQSVVFLCFGSAGSFSSDQLKEMALGLERSGQHFLWVVRPPLGDPMKLPDHTRPEPGIDELLPVGFLDRTAARGMVVNSWAPQVEVLRHEAVGGFVSHCGWNSTLEAITAGVPVVCWPLYAEQRINKLILVEEMRIGVEIKGYEKGLVEAEEVEAKVRWLMQSEGGRELRKSVAALRELGKEVLKEGGSSYAAFMEFLRHADEQESKATL